MLQTAEEEEGGAIIAPLMAAQDRVADACLQLRAHELQAEAAGETLDMGGIDDLSATIGALPAARQKQVDSQDGEKVYYFENGQIVSMDMVTDFEAAKSEYMAAKLELMQAMYDAAKTKTELSGIEFDPADFTV